MSERVADGPRRRDILAGGSAALVAGCAGSTDATTMVGDSGAAAPAEPASLKAVELKLANGDTVSAEFAASASPLSPSVLMIHEWWGLNRQIKDQALILNGKQFNVLAVDLYKGKVADTGDTDAARELMQSVDTRTAQETLGGWIDWLTALPDGNRQVGTLGWCFGGGWSLAASLVRPVEATVVYYGNVDRSADELKRLKGPVLGQFATKDTYIDKAMVARFETAMKAAGKAYEVYWYDADHAFANPSSARYDAPDAKLAWDRTLKFLGQNLGWG